MQQHLMRSPKSAKKNRKRVGRGNASGQGTYAGKGLKGQKARSGKGRMTNFQGGQLSLLKRLPSIRGFTNIFRREYAIVNVESLARFPADSEVTPRALEDAGLIRTVRTPVKILGAGELDAPLSVSAHKFSASARAKIEAAGGSAAVIE